ncbi:Hypothetical predicted protein [Cloeon dipterum]|uniref:Uncharacterized protein n=1 Tax=Cloeon dipterum TaxID=197152 RepID=A0A8S1E2S7_9INSE|nr:Hypothetical predicted protein [Cloeon dipterum]
MEEIQPILFGDAFGIIFLGIKAATLNQDCTVFTNSHALNRIMSYSFFKELVLLVLIILLVSFAFSAICYIFYRFMRRLGFHAPRPAVA